MKKVTDLKEKVKLDMWKKIYFYIGKNMEYVKAGKNK